MKNHLSTMFFGIQNRDQFFGGMQAAIGALQPSGIFTGDNLFTFNRNLSFLTDEKFVKATEAHITNEDVERAIMWRTHVVVWAAQNGLRRDFTLWTWERADLAARRPRAGGREPRRRRVVRGAVPLRAAEPLRNAGRA